jgi:hypothetical protein
MKIEFFDRFEKMMKSNFMKICPVGVELFHGDRQTDRQTDRQRDMTKIIVTFRNFANAP